MPLHVVTKKVVRSKRVFLRIAGDVPLGNRGEVLDDARLRESLPTIKLLLDAKARVILLTHIGRPKDHDESLSTKVLLPALKRLLKKEIVFVDMLSKKSLSGALKGSKESVFLCENTRFFPAEEANTKRLAREFSSCADVFVNDAFSVAHRNHLSVAGLARILPSYAGLSFAREVRELSSLQRSPKRPFVVILGGSKLETKLPVIESLVKKADRVLLGGLLCVTFLKAAGFSVSATKVEEEFIPQARVLLKKYPQKIILPLDMLGAKSPKDEPVCFSVSSHLLSQLAINLYDIGPQTQELFGKELKGARTILWNGPLGFFEREQFSKGSFVVARCIARSKARSIVGGGDTLAVLKLTNTTKKCSYVSSAGGAMLDFLAGKKLPGVEVVKK